MELDIKSVKYDLKILKRRHVVDPQTVDKFPILVNGCRRLLEAYLTLLHSKWPKLNGVLAILGAIGLIYIHFLCLCEYHKTMAPVVEWLRVLTQVIRSLNTCGSIPYGTMLPLHASLLFPCKLSRMLSFIYL